MTEPMIGGLIIAGVAADELVAFSDSRPIIEFIGDSITCGMRSAVDSIACGTARKDQDQHDAYHSFPSRIARSLNLRFRHSASSGKGIAQNWNGEEQTLPELYFKNKLRQDDEVGLQLSAHSPQTIAICLGTNDIYEPEEYPNKKYVASDFISKYVAFIRNLSSVYPEASFYIIDSPMTKGADKTALFAALQSVERQLKSENFPNKLTLLKLEEYELHGCGGHPSVADNEQIAKDLLPFFKND